MFDEGNKCGKCQNHNFDILKKGHARDCPYKKCNCSKCRLLDARSDILQVISGKETKLKGTKKNPHCGFCQNHNIEILRKGHVRSCGFGQLRHFKNDNCFDCEVHYIRNEVNRLQIKMRRAMKEDRGLSEEQRKSAREAITRDEVEQVCDMAQAARKKRERQLSIRSDAATTVGASTTGALQPQPATITTTAQPTTTTIEQMHEVDFDEDDNDNDDDDDDDDEEDAELADTREQDAATSNTDCQVGADEESQGNVATDLTLDSAHALRRHSATGATSSSLLVAQVSSSAATTQRTAARRRAQQTGAQHHQLTHDEQTQRRLSEDLATLWRPWSAAQQTNSNNNYHISLHANTQLHHFNSYPPPHLSTPAALGSAEIDQQMQQRHLSNDEDSQLSPQHSNQSMQVQPMQLQLQLQRHHQYLQQHQHHNQQQQQNQQQQLDHQQPEQIFDTLFRLIFAQIAQSTTL